MLYIKILSNKEYYEKLFYYIYNDPFDERN